MKLPFIILSRKKHEELTSMRDYLQKQVNELRSANISLGEQVRNLHFNYGETLNQLHESQHALNKAIHDLNKLKKRILK